MDPIGKGSLPLRDGLRVAGSRPPLPRRYQTDTHAPSPATGRFIGRGGVFDRMRVRRPVVRRPVPAVTVDAVAPPRSHQNFAKAVSRPPTGADLAAFGSPRKKWHGTRRVAGIARGQAMMDPESLFNRFDRVPGVRCPLRGQGGVPRTGGPATRLGRRTRLPPDSWRTRISCNGPAC